MKFLKKPFEEENSEKCFNKKKIEDFNEMENSRKCKYFRNSVGPSIFFSEGVMYKSQDGNSFSFKREINNYHTDREIINIFFFFTKEYPSYLKFIIRGKTKRDINNTDFNKFSKTSNQYYARIEIEENIDENGIGHILKRNEMKFSKSTKIEELLDYFSKDSKVDPYALLVFVYQSLGGMGFSLPCVFIPEDIKNQFEKIERNKMDSSSFFLNNPIQQVFKNESMRGVI
jgi:hypothetical protein